MNWSTYLPIIAVAVSEILGDYSLKVYANRDGGTNWKALASGIVGYIGVIYFLIMALQGSTLLYVNSMWDAMSTVIESTFAFVVLGERFDNIWKYIGMGFIFVGMFLMH